MVDYPVAFIAGTAVRGAAASVLMRNVLARHPLAFLVTLASWGLTVPMSRSQTHILRDIDANLDRLGWPRDTPIGVVGHSQGGLAAARFAASYPDRTRALVCVGAPFAGARSASRVVRLLGPAAPAAIADMTPSSGFLDALREDMGPVLGRTTNIFASHEMFFSPYTAAYLPGAYNILASSHDDYRKHLRRFPQFVLDEHIPVGVNHLSEMTSPHVRATIYSRLESF